MEEGTKLIMAAAIYYSSKYGTLNLIIELVHSLSRD